jgi:hypothetical protein
MYSFNRDQYNMTRMRTFSHADNPLPYLTNITSDHREIATEGWLDKIIKQLQ